MTIVLSIIGAAIGLFALGFIYFVSYQRWEKKNTADIAYFGAKLAQRRQLKKTIRRHSILLAPFAKILSLLMLGPNRLLSFDYEGVHGPALVSSRHTFKYAHEYVATNQDIIVATQMKCGTTWMQQIVFEIVCRGKGNLSDDGYRHMYATSPWIEAKNASVSLADAPLVGEPAKRIIKTHMPAKLCTHSDKAKYIYVARHPVSCFASTSDFIQMLAGPFAPDRKALLDWFCSDKMYWGPWPEHVEGWWQRAQEKNNVLFIHFEELKKNPEAIIAQIADFLDYQLNDDEMASVIRKSSFAYMKEYEEYFEMAPPNLFSMSSKINFMQSGTSGRHQDANPQAAQAIVSFCRQQLQHGTYRNHTPYKDLL